MKRTSTAAIALFTAASAMAHEGHGLRNPHWHASDVFGLMLAIAAAAGFWWWRGRK